MNEMASMKQPLAVAGDRAALLCIDQMERTLCALATRREPDAVRGAEGFGRVRIKHVSLPEVADRFLVPLRQFSCGDLLATDRLLAMVERCLCHHGPGSTLTASTESSVTTAEARSRGESQITRT